jgi:hypothetical protein
VIPLLPLKLRFKDASQGIPSDLTVRPALFRIHSADSPIGSEPLAGGDPRLREALGEIGGGSSSRCDGSNLQPDRHEADHLSPDGELAHGANSCPIGGSVSHRGRGPCATTWPFATKVNCHPFFVGVGSGCSRHGGPAY